MEQFYKNNMKFFQQHPLLKRILIMTTQYFPIITFIVYPCFLLYLFIHKDSYLLMAVIKPLLALITVSLIRKLINRSRPFEKYHYEPLVPHEKGQSFPSKHTLSSMVIAFTVYPVCPSLGIFLLIIGLILSLSRIFVGIHFISDILGGMIIALIISLI